MIITCSVQPNSIRRSITNTSIPFIHLRIVAPPSPLVAAMLELNILQGKSCGITDLCVVVGPATVEPIRALLGDAFHGLPVRYAFQVRLTVKETFRDLLGKSAERGFCSY